VWGDCIYYVQGGVWGDCIDYVQGGCESVRRLPIQGGVW